MAAGFVPIKDTRDEAELKPADAKKKYNDYVTEYKTIATKAAE